jgi:hypothetical protein
MLIAPISHAFAQSIEGFTPRESVQIVNVPKAQRKDDCEPDLAPAGLIGYFTNDSTAVSSDIEYYTA